MAPASPSDLAAARKRCFQLFKIVKNNASFQSGQLRSLQHHIDVCLSKQGRESPIEKEREQVAAISALEAAWQQVFRNASDLVTVPASHDEIYRLFIAYAGRDRWIAERLHSALTKHASTFLDVRCLRPGDRWVERIRSAQDRADMTILLIGDRSANLWFQEAEYLHAIELARANKLCCNRATCNLSEEVMTALILL